MNDSEPSRLDLLLFARKVLVQQAEAGLAQIDRWIAAERRQAQERRRAEERRPPPPDWLIEYTPDQRTVVALHQGDCWAAGGRRCRPAQRDQALDALRHQVSPCSACRPEVSLGWEE
ncbi:DUF6233 domain-containing protein [Streptomyces scabiei]|nr:DUF6233 domain-containing protein [Streptomyces scabiei]MDX2796666.1 DUF6233 domain-containing protein [Streptomyces scabiei]MDX2856173.1 DUF6233 domain-containing protein [Streptomyces scabiei]MDX3824546.1 DUF6233 domain-containing protein [Streptomyces scabiei]